MLQRKKLNTKALATLSLLIAIMVVLTRFFAFEGPFLRVSLTFIPFSLMGMLFGPVWTGIGGAVADVMGMLIFPKGPYFPGFTLNAFLEGIIYGFFYYRKNITWMRVIAATLIVNFFIHLFLTPLWLGLLYGVDLTNFLWWMPRLIKSFVFIPIQVTTTYYMWRKINFHHLLKKIRIPS